VSSDAVAAVAEAAAFRPTGKLDLLRLRHVPLDQLLGGPRYEQRALERLSAATPTDVVVVGARGSGKSSFTTWVSAQMPDGFVAIRLPVSAHPDPTDTAEALKLALSTILDVVQLDADIREELHRERADTRTALREPTGLTGGKLGGGAIPVQVNIEIGSLRQEFLQNRLAGEYLGGVNRAVAILRSQGITPVFVMDDTEAIVGGPDEPAIVEGFFIGPLHAFVQEIGAPCLVAVQTHLATGAAYSRLAAGMEAIEIPHIRARARETLARILERCLVVADFSMGLIEVVADDALDGLVQFYDDVGGDLRKTLAAAHGAAEDASDMRAERITASHIRVGADQWR
jgi:hypothetical protein